jgi:hypothetical protein
MIMNPSSSPARVGAGRLAAMAMAALLLLGLAACDGGHGGRYAYAPGFYDYDDPDRPYLYGYPDRFRYDRHDYDHHGDRDHDGGHDGGGHGAGSGGHRDVPVGGGGPRRATPPRGTACLPSRCPAL